MLAEMEPEGDLLGGVFGECQKKREVRFDNTGAYRLHVGDSWSSPWNAQGGTKSRQTTIQIPAYFVKGQIRNLSNNETKKESD